MTEKLAFIFPGQGSQSVGMLNDLAEQFPLIQQTFQEASVQLGYDLWNLSLHGPESELNQTERTQPALLAASIALWRLWNSQGGMQPTHLAGHSLGEYSALVVAGVIDYSDAISLVALRGRLMQAAVAEGQGAMAAIVGLDNPLIEQICQEAAQGQVLAPANYNAIGQTVIAGETAAVERAIVLAQKAGSRLAKKIAISVPSHCLLMQPAAIRLEEELKTVKFSPPKIPVINNVDVACYEQPDKIRASLVRQLYSPVRWVETIQYLASQGVHRVIECGPSKVLAGLNRRTEPGMVTLSVTAEALQQV